MSKKENASKPSTVIWVAVIGGVFALCGTIVTVLGPPVLERFYPTSTQVVAIVTSDIPITTPVTPTNTPEPTTPTPTPTSSPQPTPTPTPPLPPKVTNFTVEPSKYIYGQISTVRLAWNTEDANTVTIVGIGQVEPVGTTEVTAPEEDTVFTLLAENAGRETSTQVHVVVRRIEEFIVFEVSPALTPDLQSRIESWVSSYVRYLQDLDFEPDMGPLSVYIDPDLENNAYYTGERIVIGEPLSIDRDIVLREYTHFILNSALEDSLGESGLSVSPATRAIESGLADYFTASSDDDPRIAETSAPFFRKLFGEDVFNKPYIRTLDNDRGFSEVSPTTPPVDAGEIWGGAFWDIRQMLGQATADRLLVSTLVALQPSDLSGDQASKFVRKLLEMDEFLEGGNHASQIRSVFERRGLQL